MAAIVVEMTGDEAKLWQSFQRIAQQQAKMEGGFKQIGAAGRKAADDADKLGDSMKKAGDAGQKGFGPQALAGIAGLASGFLSAAGAVGIMTKALTDMAEARKKAGETAGAAARGFAPLAQLAGGNPEVLKRLTGTAERIYRGGGAANIEEAAGLTFELASAGAMKEADFFASLYGITDTKGLAKAGGILRSAFGEREAGSFQAILSKGLAAAGPIPGATASGLIEASAPGAAAAKALGLTDEELLAAVATIGTKTKSAETAGERTKAMLEKLVSKGFGDTMKGKPLAEMLGTIREQGLSGAKLQEYWGSSEAASAFGLLDPDQFAAMRAELDRAQEVNLADYTVYAAGQNPLIAAAKAKRRAVARREMAEMGMGGANILADAAQENVVAGMRERGYSDLQVTGMNAFSGLYRWIGGDEQYIGPSRPATDATRFLGGPLTDSIVPERMANTLDKLDKSINRFLSGPTLAKPDQDR